jgi:hypothetical protein
MVPTPNVQDKNKERAFKRSCITHGLRISVPLLTSAILQPNFHPSIGIPLCWCSFPTSHQVSQSSPDGRQLRPCSRPSCPKVLSRCYLHIDQRSTLRQYFLHGRQVSASNVVRPVSESTSIESHRCPYSYLSIVPLCLCFTCTDH